MNTYNQIQKNTKLFVYSLSFFSFFSCKTTESVEPKNNASLSDLTNRNPGLLPSPASNNAWGGNDSSRWKPEAVYANALSDFINRLWKTQSARDILVSIPITFIDSGVYPYGDGQSNARVSFKQAWPHKTVPLRSALVHLSTAPSKVILEFSPDLKLSQTKIEISYRDSRGNFKSVMVNAKKIQDDWLGAEWSSIPSELGFGSQGAATALEDQSALGTVFFVRPSPGFDDWFPVTFKHPWTTATKISATVPSSLNSFTSTAGVPAPSKLSDPMNFAQKTASDPFAFDLAYNLGMKMQWPKTFMPQDKHYYPACNVHGAFTKDDTPHDPTAVGRNWTWVADPVDQPAGAKTAPFKILYTCFEERRLHRPTGADPDCSGVSRQSEEDEGVPSGGGWHKIGNEAETLFNSLERVPLMMSAGFERPSERLGFKTPNGSYAYGLSDVAVARWLWPGEAFLTANSVKDSDGKEAKNFHWFLFHADREVCTVEWVHPKRPDDSKTAVF